MDEIILTYDDEMIDAWSAETLDDINALNDILNIK